ncbi:MAG: hypothetical protein A3F84_26145 [Candidatus Handelsmanbacteria bacterium RIFCSPLOWO2_12_FULL_64_10]|uniref:PorV/PorQ family protein n=1 Tax=Handelsmanbacteria sp. (strain RIFCSPLOWO2_12_FULL_64_10) TaxID=1817868 RepID=A0A1F6CAH5_HANXR|nr:MAG: hypothetical protein A3F84_26145 [Candidatus Handelsmanbacteria bacterium RIFCSPLOWO2_12_FULL_64_10]
MRIQAVALSLCAGLLLLTGPARAGEWDDLKPQDYNKTAIQRIGTAGLGFLKISQSARSAGMGDAFSSVADDVSAVFVNPAGITRVRKFGWTTTYTRWFVGTNIYSGAAVYSLGKGGLVGFSTVYLKPEDTEETTTLQPEGTGKIIKAGDVVIGLVYAYPMTDKLSFGIKFDWLRETILDRSLSTFKIDVGSLFHTGFHHLRVAMSLKNLGQNQSYLYTTFWMPISYNMAISDELIGKQGDPLCLTASLETVYAVDYKQRYHVGGELWLGDILALRGGYKFNYDLESYSVGAGVKYGMGRGRTLLLDVAYTKVNSLMQSPLRVSMGSTF